MKENVYKIWLTTYLVILCGVMEAATFCRKDLNLNGDIYAIGVKEYSFYMEFGEIKKGTVKNDYYTYFYPNGNVYIDSLQNTKMYKRYNYDAHNNIIEEMRIIVRGIKRKVGNTEFFYNDTTNYYSYSYDYGAGGQIKEINKYEIGLNQIQKIICSKTATEERFEYWGRRNIDKVLISTSTSRITKYYSYLNDYKSPTNTIVETLNKKGLPIKETIEAVGGLASGETIYTYDEYNNVINATSKIKNAWGQGENVITTYRYDYDNKGNWIRKLEFKNGELKTWTERTIYYASSPNDYNRIVENEKQALETIKNRLIKEKQCLDSIHNKEIEEAVRKKQHEDSLLAIKQLYEEMDLIIDREIIQKHIKASYDYNTANYNMKYYGFKNKIRECNVKGSTIEFLEKKGKPLFIANMPEYRVCQYHWSWSSSRGQDQLIGICYSNDLSNLLLYIPYAKQKGYIYDPMIVVLHKYNDYYVEYEIEKDAFDKLENLVSPYNKPQMKDMSKKHIEWKNRIANQL